MNFKIQIPATKYLLLDIPLIILSVYLSSYIRLGALEIHDHLDVIHLYTPIFVLLRIGTFIVMNVYSTIWRYVSTHDALKLSYAIGLSSLFAMAITFFAPDLGKLPRSIIIIEFLVALLFLSGARLLRRVRYEKHVGAGKNGLTTLIYGAGNNGRTLAQRFLGDRNLNMNVVGFIDDDPNKQHMKIAGLPVLGGLKNMTRFIEELKVRQLIIALPNLSADVLREVLAICKTHHIKPRITPNLLELESSTSPVDIFRDVNLNDLLNRNPRNFDVSAIRELIEGQRVLVTGAGGSIGSEVARQVMNFNPSRLILLDHSEYNLYKIDRELRQDYHDSPVVFPLLLDLKEKSSLETLCKEHSPTVVFHAAAYKHVHLVESNPFSAILNNVLSTKNLLEVCESIQVENFVLISTDKAVNPAGVMGATKRVCEYLTSIYGQRSQKNYLSVRFGNVLGSSGSLIPLLKQQIRNGGPVTITHKDMTRYFMLIPEAVKLVLKASTIAKSGDICLLKMGEPVKILDIAKNLILLMAPKDMEIPISFTGLRPGEKMFEELYITGNELQTEDEDILVVPNGDQLENNDLEQTHKKIETLIELAQKSDKESIFILNQLVSSNYVPPENSKSFLLFNSQKGNA